jgi:DNA primase
MLYGIKGTGPGERAWEQDWALRIVIPLHNAGGHVIGAQGRDITGKHKLRYVGSPLEHSAGDYKRTLYGAHLATGDKVCLVEGVFDAWKGGPGFVASYGTAMTPEQIAQLKRWDTIYVLFDSEPTAQRKAKEYASLLASLGKRAFVVDLDKDGLDLGDLSIQEARELRLELGFRG